MTTPSTQDLLKYARLQMAAEAMLNPGKWADNSDRKGGYAGTDLEDALKVGNNHSSRFTATDAEAFRTEGWIVKEQIETDTGFSGTLFYNRDLNEYVVSFRSTEFIDDHIRDNVSTNTMEIFEAGFAFGQLRDMEAWMEKRRVQNLLPASAQPDPSTGSGRTVGCSDGAQGERWVGSNGCGVLQSEVKEEALAAGQGRGT